MPIIKYIAVHSSPLKLLVYVTNENKTRNTLTTSINCSTDPYIAYKEMEQSFEHFSGQRFWKKSLFMRKEILGGKERVRLHHYIQSFKAGEISEAAAHRIGVEWAQEVFGNKFQVLISTHTDKGHYHNHFVVCPYDDDGKLWRADKKSLNRCKVVSDRIALRHHISIIERPKKTYNHKYGDYLSRQRRNSWKENLKAELDEIVMRDDVHSIDDLTEKLKEKGYGVNMKKYLSIKVKPDRKPIRTYRLGDGYFLEHLAYRIEHKNFEMPLSQIAKYEGIQREYAICLRQIQIILYKSPEPERQHYVSYRSVLKNFELLNFLHDNNIRTHDAFKSVVDKAEGRYTEVLNVKKKLEDKISETEKIIADFPRYKELVRKNSMTKAERKELKKLSYLADKGIYAPEHLQEKKLLLENLKSQLDNLDENIKAVKAEWDKLTDYYDTYIQLMQNDSDFLLERAKEEHERMAQAVEIEENHEQERKYYYEK